MRASFLRLSAALSVALSPVVLIVACGGVVVVDEGGTGGNTATSNGTAPDTGSWTDTTGTWTDTTGTWTDTTSTGTFPTTSTGTVTVTGTCDAIGDCGENGGGCIECAINGPCSAELDACLNIFTCTQYSDCISMCAPDNQACLDACEAQNPEGAALYKALIGCVICEQCAASCAGQDWGCSP